MPIQSDTTPRILVVDDSPIAAELARRALADAGFDVVTANDFAELEARCAEAPVALILMDVQMPELYGDDVAVVLRSVREIDASIYLLSSLPAEELEERARDAGVDGYICKQEGAEALVARVRTILAPGGTPDGNQHP